MNMMPMMMPMYQFPGSMNLPNNGAQPKWALWWIREQP